MPTARYPKSNDVVEEAHIHNRSGGQLYRCFYSGLERMGGQEAAYRVGDRVDNDGEKVGRMAILRCIIVRFMVSYITTERAKVTSRQNKMLSGEKN